MEQEHDQPESQYHTLFRQYDAVLGRWWSIDPEQERYASFSPYTAMGANPVNFVDQFGNYYVGNDGKKIDFKVVNGNIEFADNITGNIKRLVSLINDKGSERARINFMKVADNKSRVSVEIVQENDPGKYAVHRPYDKDGNLLNWNSVEQKFEGTPDYEYDADTGEWYYREAKITIYENMFTQENIDKKIEALTKDGKFNFHNIPFAPDDYMVATFGHELFHNFDTGWKSTNMSTIEYIRVRHLYPDSKEYNDSPWDAFGIIEQPAFNESRQILYEINKQRINNNKIR